MFVKNREQEHFGRDATLYDLGALACYELGLLRQACDFAREAVERSLEDSRLSHNYMLIQSRLHRYPHPVLSLEYIGI